MSLLLQQDSAMDAEALSEVVSEEKTLSIISLIMDGGLGGQIIVAFLFYFYSSHFTFTLKDF